MRATAKPQHPEMPALFYPGFFGLAPTLPNNKSFRHLLL
jgi:hypothetical protein